MLNIRAVSERTHRLPEPQWLRSSAGPAVAVSVCIAEGEMERMAIKVGQKADIACEDNLRYMRKLPDRLMHLIVTSPPYNIGKAYEPQKTRKDRTPYSPIDMNTVFKALLESRGRDVSN